MNHKEREEMEKKHQAILSEIVKQYGEDVPFVMALPDGFLGGGKDYETRGLAENLLDYVVDMQEAEIKPKLGEIMTISSAADLQKLPPEVKDAVLRQTNCGDPDCKVHGDLNRE